MGYIYIHKIFYLNSSRKSIDIHTETDSTEIYRFSKTNANDSENTHFFTSKPYINPEFFFQGKNSGMILWAMGFCMAYWSFVNFTISFFFTTSEFLMGWGSSLPPWLCLYPRMKMHGLSNKMSTLIQVTTINHFTSLIKVYIFFTFSVALAWPILNRS